MVQVVESVAAGPAKVLKFEGRRRSGGDQTWGALRQEKAARNNEGSWGNWIGFDSRWEGARWTGLSSDPAGLNGVKLGREEKSGRRRCE